ncbi:class I SAM-dependent methyltransferase [Baaleninema simplex]|uniref:class I SAM-dependent methyltransferase n=1 Tax=Baaleninema simplex TaxID=2862350 RepID=UPI000347EC32|nr:class I SAM-dependent methyltransferase [Baaleninema simplex]
MKFSKLFRVLRRWQSEPSHLQKSQTLAALAVGSYRLDRPHETGVWETFDIEACGVLRVVGWTRSPWESFDPLRVYVNGSPVPLLSRFQTYRPDLLPLTNSGFSGTAFEYGLPYETPIAELAIDSNGTRIWCERGELVVSRPAYDRLLSGDRVLHREQIYGVGTPSPVTSEVVLSLTQPLPAPILDFGCGIGALVRELRSRDVEAYGLEIDRPAITNGILPEVAEFVTCYDGSFPLPYEDEHFSSVVSIEVLEHIPDYEKALAELARITRDRAAFTVPNINAIPLCFPHQVVPWHLLEATHFNFFNQASFQKTLERYFSEVQFAQIHPVTVNGTQFFTSLAAICRK